MMKTFIYLLICLANIVSAKAKIVNPDSTGFRFTDTKVVNATPVKDQHKSGTCWCYATCSFLENEILRKTGKEVHLSEGFVVNHCYIDKAVINVRMDGNTFFTEGGDPTNVVHVWKNYGMMPHEAYTGMQNSDRKFSTHELTDALSGYLNVINKHQLGKISPSWQQGYKGILEAFMGEIPNKFIYQDKEYTPKTFAASLQINPDDYLSISSFNHHPFYEPFILEVPYNWLWYSFQNIPIDELVEVVYNAIDNGHTVAWVADVSEKGFKWYKGYAILPEEKDLEDKVGSDMEHWAKMNDADREIAIWYIMGPVKDKYVTQTERQEMFDNKETTNDHVMVIIGTAKDQKGNRYFKVQNSWDNNQIYGGFFYASEAYFRAKTISIMINKKVIPSRIAQKMGL
ncbi:MAG: C1 family peptidase [Prevotella sp.]|nr:C1 family peptidase [Prevotella sp.]